MKSLTGLLVILVFLGITGSVCARSAALWHEQEESFHESSLLRDQACHMPTCDEKAHIAYQATHAEQKSLALLKQLERAIAIGGAWLLILISNPNENRKETLAVGILMAIGIWLL